MSHYAEMEIEAKTKYEKEFVEALEEKYGVVEVHGVDDPSPLFGYKGDNRSTKSEDNPDWAPKCHIVVRRKHVGGASNDIGFRRDGKGGYTAYVSEYDRGNTHTPEVSGKVAQRYAAAVTKKTMKASGYSVTEKTNEKGEVVLTCQKF